MIIKLIDDLLNLINIRFNDIYYNTIYKIAIINDPRFKNKLLKLTEN